MHIWYTNHASNGQSDELNSDNLCQTTLLISTIALPYLQTTSTQLHRPQDKPPITPVAETNDPNRHPKSDAYDAVEKVGPSVAISLPIRVLASNQSVVVVICMYTPLVWSTLLHRAGLDLGRHRADGDW